MSNTEKPYRVVNDKLYLGEGYAGEFPASPYERDRVLASTDREWAEMLRDEMRHDAEAPEVWCACCQTFAHKANWCATCRCSTCPECERYDLPRGFDCVVCYNRAEHERTHASFDGAFGQGIAFFCPLILCVTEGPHSHRVKP